MELTSYFRHVEIGAYHAPWVRNTPDNVVIPANTLLKTAIGGQYGREPSREGHGSADDTGAACICAERQEQG